ncbi:unnamed protein product [Rotaria socialis]|uniref:Hexosyltransferase n=2 Tax=Rotaria socialis TaxID=392032 RepID=A0A817RH78_9BILA|nr:unnamed protein product [Rotaria socialis]CAF3709751.1 unnamed protein product [Rotaria socialis]CAF4438468.1 unnamed protein product [Rotaria socialis]CAF4513835.1 unnamed protein product [Rotaria socialis]CAF4797548.1 unnamed protein product [Rotaria socialis]
MQPAESAENTDTINLSYPSITINPYIPQDHIVNPHNFSYILNPNWNVCQGNVYVIVYVHSAPAYYQRRVLIRETWATRNLFPEIRLVFMLGQMIDNKIMQAVKFENDLYQDIVQEDFLDSYRNLTYKAVMALKWISTYCSQASYILKTDDDMIVNTFTLLKHLKFLDSYQMKQNNSIFCQIYESVSVFRNKNIKWYLSEKEYPPKKFPPFCSGSAFILTNDLAKTIYNMSLYVPFLWIDDVYITGLVAQAVNVTFNQLKSLYTLKDDLVYRRFTALQSFYSAMFGHLSNSLSIKRKIWQHILTMHTHSNSEQYKAMTLDANKN